MALEAKEKYSKMLLNQIEEYFAKVNALPLCHYTGASALCSILRNHELWFTKWHSLNDPSEFQILHELINNHLKDYKNDGEFYHLLEDINAIERYKKGL